VGRRSVVGWTVCVAGLVFGGRLAYAGAEAPFDPCAGAVGQTEVTACWAREAERADTELEGVYQALRSTLPERAARSLEKAQALWREFRDAHVATLYGADDPAARWGRDYPMCLSIARFVLTRERTRELRRLLEPGEETVCPL